MNTGTPGFGLVLVGLLAIVSFDLVLVLLMVSGGIRGDSRIRGMDPRPL